MTSKLKCPVCQQELGIILCDIDDFVCSKCRMCGDEKLWKALIQAKRDLETISAKYAQFQKSAEIARQASDNSREKLAAFMHDTWGNWFAYQLNNSTVENLQRWGVQSNTPYSSLSETDKDKDRKFADKIIEIIKEQIDHIADVSKMIEHKE